MIKLICTYSEFHRFIGPRIRNSIQTLTKKRKRECNNICVMCKEKKELEAAHIHGKERKKIIVEILKKYLVDKEKNLVEIPDLEKIEKEIMNAHKPIDKFFKFLCFTCHREYDGKD